MSTRFRFAARVGMVWAVWAAAVPVWAQGVIYRCGNEYTNARPDPSRTDCRPITEGNVTVVQAPRIKAAPASGAAAATAAAPKVAAGEQKLRDNDARLILEAELKKTRDRLEDLRREYNNGQPEKRAEETRNHQRYLDRVADLKAQIARLESDVAGITRELARTTGAGTSAAGRLP